ncbi:MAG: transposase [Bacteroidales bacterium]
MEPLQPERYYHVYNHGNAWDTVFCEDENYRFFMEKYLLHVSPVVNTYAYCLMPNHFHFFVRIKSLAEYLGETGVEKIGAFLERSKNYKNLAADLTNINFSKVPDFRKVNFEEAWLAFVSKQYSNLFSSYTQAFNKKYARRGALFLSTFKRRMLTSSEFRNMLLYIVCNPVHHGFVSNPFDWKYSEPKGPDVVFPGLDLSMANDLFDGYSDLKYALINNRYQQIEEE